LFRALAGQTKLDVTVYFCLEYGIREYLDSEFGVRLKWDIPLIEGYKHCFLRNWNHRETLDKFWGAVNPGIIGELIDKRYDGIIIQGYGLATHWLAYIGAWMTRTPVFFRGETVWRPTRPWAIRLAKRMLLAPLFFGTRAFLSIGSHSREFYRRFGVPESCVFFSPYSVDNDFFSKESSFWRLRRDQLLAQLGLEDRPVLLFVGKLAERKRPLDLLTAYEPLSKVAALVFVGDGHLRAHLERETRNRGLNQVVFVGFQNQLSIPKYYGLADIFVLPSSEQEVCPLVVNEAMACGLPVVLSDSIPSARDFVTDGYNGFIYPCGNIQRLTSNLLCLVTDRALRRTMSERTSDRISGWNVKKSAESIVQAIEACTKNSMNH